MTRRMGVYAVVSSLALLAASAVHVHERSAAAEMATPSSRPQQATVTVTPTNWQAQARVVGRVVAEDSTDTPIEGARVILYAGDNRCDWSIVTNSTGTFDLACYHLHFENLFFVHVVAAGYHPWQGGGLLYGRVELQPQLQPIALTPRPTPTPLDVAGYVITSGTVRDAADGRSLANVRVAVGNLPHCLTPVRSHDAGDYELVCPIVSSLGRYLLTASLRGYVDYSRELPGYELGGVSDIAMDRVGAETATATHNVPPTVTPGTATPQAQWRAWIPACDVSSRAGVGE